MVKINFYEANLFVKLYINRLDRWQSHNHLNWIKINTLWCVLPSHIFSMTYILALTTKTVDPLGSTAYLRTIWEQLKSSDESFATEVSNFGDANFQPKC